MNWQLFLGSTGILGVLAMIFFGGRWFGKAEKAFEEINKKFDSQSKQIGEFKSDIRYDINKLANLVDMRFEKLEKIMETNKETISNQIGEINTRVSRLEGRDDERFGRKKEYASNRS